MSDDLLTAEMVAARYGFADPRTARRLIHEAGGFRLGGRLFIRRDHLLGHEANLRRPAAQPPPPAPIARSRRSRKTSRPAAPLQPGWWRDNDDHKELT